MVACSHMVNYYKVTPSFMVQCKCLINYYNSRLDFIWDQYLMVEAINIMVIALGIMVKALGIMVGALCKVEAILGFD